MAQSPDSERVTASFDEEQGSDPRDPTPDRHEDVGSTPEGPPDTTDVKEVETEPAQTYVDL